MGKSRRDTAPLADTDAASSGACAVGDFLRSRLAARVELLQALPFLRRHTQVFTNYFLASLIGVGILRSSRLTAIRLTY